MSKMKWNYRKSLMTGILLIITFSVMTGCSSKNENGEGTGEPTTATAESSAMSESSATSETASTEAPLEVDGYRQINQTTAQKMMEENEGYIILDVRTEEEYNDGHIPDAVLLPNESIGETDDIELLPDKDQLIFVYCRSGRRSKEASKKLADLGYTNVYEFGGIIDWAGPTVKEKTSDMKLTIGNEEVAVDWEDNESVNALKEMTEEGAVTIQLSMYGGNEQVGSIGTTLPSDDKNTTTNAGDIVLYNSSNIVIFYGSNTWDYTRLGKVTDKTADEMTELLSNGDVTITLSK